MNAGIVCKVWNVQGATNGKKTDGQLSDSLGYILNNEKTGLQTDVRPEIFSDEEGQLERECKYIGDDIKTVAGAYIGTRNLISDSIRSAVNEMMEVKKFYGKIGGRAALHGIISLPSFESGIKNAPNLMKLCDDVLKELFPNHQAIFAIHTNTDDLHVHFIVNSVGLDGKKIHQPDGFIKNVVQPCVNKYAIQYGFTPNEKWNKYHEKNATKYALIKMELRKVIDKAIETAVTFEDFVSDLYAAGITVNVGKHVSLQMEGMEKAIRTYQLGENYTKDAIVERIKSRQSAFQKIYQQDYDIAETTTDKAELYLNVLKKYKDLLPEDKKVVLQKLREGKNPWRERARRNWQLQNIANNMNMMVRINSYLSFYSSDGSMQGALNGILDLKRQIARGKKEIYSLQKKYKPILDIYMEMKKIAKKSFLYEYEGIEEYREYYEKYRELTRRLKNGYNKEVFEVAAFAEECHDRILYANAQLNELSCEYREIKKYCEKNGIESNDKKTLFTQIDHRRTISLAKQNVFITEVTYLVSANYPDILLRVVKDPMFDDKGKVVENTSLTLLTLNGEVIEHCDSKDGMRGFNQYVNKLENEYGIKNCEIFTDALKAKEFAKNCIRIRKQKMGAEVIESDSKLPSSKKDTLQKPIYTFTQAINLKSVVGKRGIYAIANVESNSYAAVISSSDDSISIKIIDIDGKEQETVTIPSIHEKNMEGFNKISALWKKYGFSEKMYAFDSMDEAKQHIYSASKKVRIK